jgi:hypothetical protein
MDYMQSIRESALEPHQYRFGMAGENQDDTIERFLRLHDKGIALNLGSGGNYQRQQNIGQLVKKVIAGDLYKPIIKNLDEEGKNRDEIKPYTDFGAMNLLLKGQPQRNLYLSILDAKNLPFRTESIDIILLLGVFNALRQESLKCQSEYTGSDFVNQVIGECYRVNKQKSHLLICNNVLEPKQDYIQIIQDKGYEIIETLEGKDAEGHTGSLGRYLLVCER